MDFKLTEEQEFFQKTVADTVDRMIMPKVEYIDEHPEEFPWDLWKEFTSLGYLGLRYPEEIGGMDADVITANLFYQEMGWDKVSGAPTRAAYQRVGLAQVAQELAEKGLLPG